MLLLALSLGSLIGSLLLVSLKQLPSPLFVIFLVSCMVVGVSGVRISKRNINKHSFLFLTLFTLSAILGFSWASLRAYEHAWMPPDICFERPIFITGRILSTSVLNTFGKKSEKYTIELSSINSKSLKWVKAKVELVWQSPAISLQAGQVIEGTVWLKRQRSMMNLGGRDEEKYWFLERIKAKGRILTVSEIKEPISLLYIRNTLARKLTQLFPDETYLSVITALTLGLRSGLDAESKQVFQLTGTSHLLAISGLHLGLVASLCFFLVRRIVCIFPNILLRCPAPIIAATFTLIFSFIYALLAGFGLPTQRAFIMICVFMIAVIFKRHVLSWHAYLLALWLVLLHDPLCVLQAGFWLSFLAVAALIMSQRQIKASTFKQKWAGWWQPQWRIFIALFPLTIMFFHQVSLVAPIANFVAIPVVSAIIVPLSLLGILLLYPFEWLCKVLIHCALICFSAVWFFLDFLSRIPFAAISIGTESIIAVIFAIIGCGVWLLPKGIPGRGLALVLGLPLFLYHPILPKQQARISILDVGQGLCALIETRNYVMLFDTGPKYSEFSDAGNRVIIPFLEAKNIKKLDKIVLSHHDLDHRGGLHRLNHFNISDLRSSEPHLLAQLGYSTQSLTLCQSAQTWEWDGVHFEILHPSGDEKKRNDRSCVLKVTANNQSILLPGDITSSVEKKLIQTVKEKLKSDILIVPHHGSMTSSSSEFIQAVAPRYSVFAVGFNNSFGFPKQAILERYKAYGSENLLTYNTGTIVFELGKKENLTPPMKWRETAKRIWHDNNVGT